MKDNFFLSIDTTPMKNEKQKNQKFIPDASQYKFFHKNLETWQHLRLKLLGRVFVKTKNF